MFKGNRGRGLRACGEHSVKEHGDVFGLVGRLGGFFLVWFGFDFVSADEGAPGFG